MHAQQESIGASGDNSDWTSRMLHSRPFMFATRVLNYTVRSAEIAYIWHDLRCWGSSVADGSQYPNARN